MIQAELTELKTLSRRLGSCSAETAKLNARAHYADRHHNLDRGCGKARTGATAVELELVCIIPNRNAMPVLVSAPGQALTDDRKRALPAHLGTTGRGLRAGFTWLQGFDAGRGGGHLAVRPPTAAGYLAVHF